MLSDHVCTECAHLLLAHNAPVKVKNAQGWSPLAEAISYGDRQMSKCLWMWWVACCHTRSRLWKCHPHGYTLAWYQFSTEIKVDLKNREVVTSRCKSTVPHCCLQADAMMLAYLLCPSERRNIPQGSLAFMLQWKAIHYPFLFLDADFLSPCFTHFLRKDPSSLYFE